MNHSRRDVLQLAGAATTAAALSTVASTSTVSAAVRKRANQPTLVAIYLRGGVDALSTVVPYTDKEYARYRPSLALASPGKGAKAVLPLDDHFGFNPNMKKLHGLYERGMCVPIMNVGSPHPTRSHFDAQDFMERGAPGSRQVATGWLNRYLYATRTSQDANLRAVSMQPLLPRSLRGEYPVLAKPEQKADQAMEVFGQMYNAQNPTRSPSKRDQKTGQGTRQTLEAFGAKTIQQLWELTQILEQSPPSQVEYPEGRFGTQMKEIATLIKADRGLEVTAADYGGWDHHINVGPVDGQLGKKLADVSDSIGAFADDLGPERMRQTLVLVMSEFGRTVKENNNQGADHGHGGIMLVIGGKLSGGKVYGKWTGLGESNLYQRRDLPVHTDFRVVFAELLKGLFRYDGLSRNMFEDYKPQQDELLGLMA